MTGRPISIPSTELEEAFSTSSRRIVMAALVAQIREAEIHGIGGCPWVDEMREAVTRIGEVLSETQDPPCFRGRVALRLL